MARRLPSTPPVLPGFTYVTVLGSGGFADVFLYEQDMPRRQVAVKVMLAEIVTERLRTRRCSPCTRRRSPPTAGRTS
jgi:hypothetical protein